MFERNTQNDFYSNTSYFLVVTIGVFAITFGVLYYLNLVPGSLQQAGVLPVEDKPDQVEDELIAVTLPDRITIPKIGLDAIVGHAPSPDIDVLNRYVAAGAVYYPGSGTIEQGNIFVFGHSSDYFRSVQNPADKVFNNLTKLSVGDQITVTGDGKKYVYVVTTVENLKEDDALVTFDTSSRKITLSTCNTFGQKQDRTVVEAEFSHEV